MGKSNRQRRAAKARQRAEQRRDRHAHAQAGRGDPPPRPADLPPADETPPWSPHAAFMAAARALRAGDEAAARASLARVTGARRDELARSIAGWLDDATARAWERGWQPADLHRVVGRQLGRNEATVIRCAIASQARGYEDLGARVAPGWMAQLNGIDATRRWDARRPYVLQICTSWFDAVMAASLVLDLMQRLPILPRLVDPPSAWLEGSVVAGASLPAGVLAKVRALLAKAESTTFDAEAEAFTAKAQELMARHRIDQAVLAASGHGAGEEPIGRRIGVEDPYGDAKAMLLAGIAGANGCRAVWDKGFGFSTVFGFADELDAVEELFTSLLVQATAALRREGSKQDRYGRSRTRRFRRSFLVAFALRITARLHEAVDDVVEATSVETGTALVPVLAARTEATRAAADAAFPGTKKFSPSATDREGWYLGTLFGDQADLAVAERLERPA